MLMSFATLLLNVVFMPYLLAAAIPIVLLFLFIRQYYLKSAREIKRLEAMSESKNIFLSFVFVYVVVQFYPGGGGCDGCVRTLPRALEVRSL